MNKFTCIFFFFQFSSLSHVRLLATPWTAAHQVSLSITNFQSLLRLMFIKLVMPPINFIFCLPLYLLPLIFASIRVFSNKLVLRIRWPKYGRLGFSIGPSNEYSGLMLKLKLQYFGYLMRRTDSLEKTLTLGKIEGRKRRGQQRMRWLDGIRLN